jgi:hypothetical protein
MGSPGIFIPTQCKPACGGPPGLSGNADHPLAIREEIAPLLFQLALWLRRFLSSFPSIWMASARADTTLTPAAYAAVADFCKEAKKNEGFQRVTGVVLKELKESGDLFGLPENSFASELSRWISGLRSSNSGFCDVRHDCATSPTVYA